MRRKMKHFDDLPRRRIFLANVGAGCLGLMLFVGSEGCAKKRPDEEVMAELASRFVAAMKKKDLAAARACLSARGQIWATDEKITREFDAWTDLVQKSIETWGGDGTVQFGPPGEDAKPVRAVVFRRIQGTWYVTATTTVAADKVTPVANMFEPPETLVLPPRK
jgi:hypothetical protein